MTDPARPSALAGIRVLDLATILAAPVAATMLGDFGADVVKVEIPRRGDFIRGNDRGDRSPQWAQDARNKTSITLDLHTEAGQELARRLVPHFDVVLCNLRPPTMERWGLEPERLLELNPRAVIACVTGYGLTGPYRDRGAFDRIASAFAGLTYVSGYPDQPPVRSGYALIDYMSAYLAAFAVVTALYHRDAAGGEGQIIDLALYEAGFRASEDALPTFATTGRVRERAGNRNLGIVPASDFRTADGRLLSVHAATDSLFRRLCSVISQPALVDDPRFATRAARAEHQDELYPIIEGWVAGRTADEATKLLSDAGIPAAPLMSVADIASDPHYLARGTIETVEDPDFGQLPMTAPIPTMSATPGRIRRPGPALGEGNESVYGGLLGLSGDELDRLRSEGVI